MAAVSCTEGQQRGQLFASAAVSSIVVGTAVAVAVVGVPILGVLQKLSPLDHKK